MPHVYLRDTKDCYKITIESSLPKDPFNINVNAIKEASHNRAVESINKEKVAEVVLFLNRRLEQYEQEDSDFCEGMRLAYRVALEKLKQCFEM